MTRADEHRSGKPQGYGQLHLDAGDRQPVVLFEDVFQSGTPTLAAHSIVPVVADETRPRHVHVMQQDYAPYLEGLA
jgi:hypothetical protein